MNLAPEELPAEDSLVCYYADLEQLLDPKLLITYAYWTWKAKGQAFCERVFDAWKSAMRSLPSSAGFSKLLHRCLALLGALEDAEDFMRAADPDVFPPPGVSYSDDRFQDFHEKCWPGDPFEDFLQKTFAAMTIEFARQQLDAPTIEEAFSLDGNDSEKVKGDLWKLVNGHPIARGSFVTCGGLDGGLGAELMMALIEKGLPKWCWTGSLGPNNANLLLQIIEPIAAQPWDWDDEEEAKGRLCIFLAERFSLEELCRENLQGKNVLHKACNLCAFFLRHGPVEHIWIEVQHVIAQRMVQGVREFEGSLPELIELARSVHYGLQGNLSLRTLFLYEGKSQSQT